MEFRQFFISTLLVALVVIGIFSFVVTTQSNYDVAQPILNSSKIGYIVNLKNNVTTVFNNSNSSDAGFYAQPPSVDTGGLMLTSIVGSGRLLFSSVTLIYDLLVGGVSNTLGIDPAVTMILESMLIGGVILLIWSLVRLGR